MAKPDEEATGPDAMDYLAAESAQLTLEGSRAR